MHPARHHFFLNDPEHLLRIYRVRASSRFSEEAEALTPHRVAHFTAVLAAISAGRRELLRMHRANEIHDTLLQTAVRRVGRCV